MSTHPNAMLIATLTPDDLARKTYRAILEDEKVEEDHDIKIGKNDYHHLVMEDEYNESWQVSGKEGQILVFDLVTYGYGESVEWSKLVALKEKLEEWAKRTCEKHHCNYEISVSANYW